MAYLPNPFSYIFAYTTVADVIAVPTATWTPITFHAEGSKTNITHSTSADTDEFTIITPGNYLLTASVAIEEGAGNSRSFRYQVNGGPFRRDDRSPIDSVGGTQFGGIVGEGILAKDDVITLEVYQDSGGDLDIDDGIAKTLITIYQLR